MHTYRSINIKQICTYEYISIFSYFFHRISLSIFLLSLHPLQFLHVLHFISSLISVIALIYLVSLLFLASLLSVPFPLSLLSPLSYLSSLCFLSLSPLSLSLSVSSVTSFRGCACVLKQNQEVGSQLGLPFIFFFLGEKPGSGRVGSWSSDEQNEAYVVPDRRRKGSYVAYPVPLLIHSWDGGQFTYSRP